MYEIYQGWSKVYLNNITGEIPTSWVVQIGNKFTGIVMYQRLMILRERSIYINEICYKSQINIQNSINKLIKNLKIGKQD